MNGLKTATKLPELFSQLEELGCLNENSIRSTSDGFFAATVSLADILAQRGIATVPGQEGKELECRLFFDDWYIYAVSGEGGFTYGLFKMREQEHDLKLGLHADGDIPGVTVSFISFRENILLQCLHEPSHSNKDQLNQEINRVVAAGGQSHSKALKAYFLPASACGAYLIAELYTSFIASLAKDGYIPVPEHYASDFEKQGVGGRVPRFMEELNRSCGKTICDHEKIYIASPSAPTEQERLAILASHCGNCSNYSFAAELQFHALFLSPLAKLPIPFVGRSPYSSAIRADMSIGDGEFTGPTPYYLPNSSIVRKQKNYHSSKRGNEK